MYSGAWRRLPKCRFLDWPEYQGEATIVALADRIIAEQDIKEGDYLIGTSLGGIVACEIANRIDVAGLVLVGSAKNKSEINALLRMLHPLASLTPLEFIQKAAGKVPGDLAQMFHEGQAPFIRAMCHAIFEWEGLDETRIEQPRRIHGRHDRVIPHPDGVQHWLDGGHLIVMTHARECVEFLSSQWSPVS
jgi:surfactin synthase thioesterase subunit